jgi:hypothetical protein
MKMHRSSRLTYKYRATKENAMPESTILSQHRIGLQRWMALVGTFAIGLASSWSVDVDLAAAGSTPKAEQTTGSGTGIAGEPAQPAHEAQGGQGMKEYRVLLPGNRIVAGIVESVVGDVVKVNIGQLEPLFLSLKEAKEKGLPSLKRGDKIQVVLNDHNVIVDYHPTGQQPWHRIIRGRLAQPLPVGHEWAVIRTDEGNDQAFAVRPLARSKVSAIPVNTPAVFLVDEANKLVDATFGSEDMIRHKVADWKKSPPKAPYRRIEGTLVRARGGPEPSPALITIKTSDGIDHVYEVRPYLQEELAKAPDGSPIILLVDDENKVADLAKPPTSRG